MKILHIITSLKIGGAERALCNLVESLSCRGFQHFVAYFYPGPCVDVLQKLNVPTYQITGMVHHYDLRAYTQLTNLVRTIKPDVLHTSLWSANIIGRIIGFRYDIPIISDLHGNAVDEGKFRNILDRYTAHVPCKIVAVSDSVKNIYKKQVLDKIPYKKFRSVACSNLITINNGIDPDKIRTAAQAKPLKRSDLGIPDNTFLVGAIGRLEPIKSYDVLIRAFAELNKTISNLQDPAGILRPLHLIIVGDGSQRHNLEKLAADLGVSNITFTGMRTDAQCFYPLFDCFALSSQSEGLSIALLEALCFGLPIITTHDSMEHDVISNGINGFLVQPNNTTAFARAILTLYQSPDNISAMQSANIDLIDKHFHIAENVKSYAKIFEQAIISHQKH